MKLRSLVSVSLSRLGGPRARLSLLVIACAGLLAAVAVACSATGFTPNCNADAGDCLTPPGDAMSDIILGAPSDAGTQG